MDLRVCKKCLGHCEFEIATRGIWFDDVSSTALYFFKPGEFEACCDVEIERLSDINWNSFVPDNLRFDGFELIDKSCPYYLEHFLHDSNDEQSC